MKLTRLEEALTKRADEITEFARALVRIESVTGNEEKMAEAVIAKMHELAYDQVICDELGNVVGINGDGSQKIFFDSHMDTVDVIDRENWKHDPYGAEVESGFIYGRGAVDMKGALAASVYAGAIAKELGLLEGRTVYVSASIMEEDYDGQAVNYILEKDEIHPDLVVICEPTDLCIGYGHQGRALIQITIRGKGAHASHPETGINPVYLMREVIGRTEQLAASLQAKRPTSGSLAITNIFCTTASNNSVPEEASIILDRRLALKEDEEYMTKEMNELVKGTKAEWKIVDVPGRSYKGKEITLHSFLPAWELPPDHQLILAAKDAVTQIRQKEAVLQKLAISTNAVVTAGIRKIPTVVLGPGDINDAHATDEKCSIEAIHEACSIYVRLIDNL